jgi:hypothetical protein
MSRTQFLRGEVSPRIDIDTVTIGNTKETLRFAHYRTYALTHRID